MLLFLLEHAPLKTWQRDVLSIIRDEAYYFAPQGQTKIMNEGWASYWHSHDHDATRRSTPAEVIDYADHHRGTLASSPTRLNPYKLGIELFRDIEDRWNRGAVRQGVRRVRRPRTSSDAGTSSSAWAGRRSSRSAASTTT